MDNLPFIKRNKSIFSKDIFTYEKIIKKKLKNSRILIIGGAGSIGQAVAKEIFVREPMVLHVVDINENNLVELVRDLRSSYPQKITNFKTFAIDCGSKEFEILMNSNNNYNYIFNLSALKHVRSEKDPYTLMRMTRVNIVNNIKILSYCNKNFLKSYFCVSTDKAANPINMMGASKKIMEMFLLNRSLKTKITMARFANVAFSDGSLLHGFNLRHIKKQPLSVPNDIYRYFITKKEAGELCMLSCLFGSNRDIFFPKLSQNLKLIKLTDIAKQFVKNIGYKPFFIKNELEAIKISKKLIKNKKWPIYIFNSDTTGEKESEEFFTKNEKINFKKFKTINVIKNNPYRNKKKLDQFIKNFRLFNNKRKLNKKNFIKIYKILLNNFILDEKNKYLDDKM